MKNFVEEMELKSTREVEFFDLTEKVCTVLGSSRIQNGFVNVSTQHTTTAVVLNEREENLQKDMAVFLSRFAPARQGYAHDKNPLDGRLNTHSHLQSLFLPTSQTISVVNGEMKLGKWQTLFFIELDGPRSSRKITIQIIGQ